MANQTIKKLYDFINQAKRFAKYPQNTALGMVAALKVVEQGLLPEEPHDLQYIADHLDEIYSRQLDKLSLSPASIGTYIARVKRVISDYNKYGSDHKAWIGWKPRSVQRAPRTRPKEASPLAAQTATHQTAGGSAPFPAARNGQLKTLLWSLRPDLDIQIQLPRDLNKKDIQRLVKLLEFQAELSEAQSDQE